MPSKFDGEHKDTLDGNHICIYPDVLCLCFSRRSRVTLNYNFYFDYMVYLQSILTVIKTVLEVQSTCVKGIKISPVKVQTCTGVGLAE